MGIPEGEEREKGTESVFTFKKDQLNQKLAGRTGPKTSKKDLQTST